MSRSPSPDFVPNGAQAETNNAPPLRGSDPSPRDNHSRDPQPERIQCEQGETTYLLGRHGATRDRLTNFSGARIEIDTQTDLVGIGNDSVLDTNEPYFTTLQTR